MAWNQEKAKATQFKTDRPESCTAQINIKITPTLKAKLKNMKGWHEKVRDFLEEEAKAQSA